MYLKGKFWSSSKRIIWGIHNWQQQNQHLKPARQTSQEFDFLKFHMTISGDLLADCLRKELVTYSLNFLEGNFDAPDFWQACVTCPKLGSQKHWQGELVIIFEKYFIASYIFRNNSDSVPWGLLTHITFKKQAAGSKPNFLFIFTAPFITL